MRDHAPGTGLLHPVALVAMAVLALNDHWGKAAWPGLLTGKLSDVAGLLFFPLALQALWEVLSARGTRRWAPSRTVLVVAAVTTAVGFALVKLSPLAGEVYRSTFGALRWPLDAGVAVVRGAPVPAPAKVMLTQDATDLVALPAILLATLIGWGRAARHARHATNSQGDVGRDPGVAQVRCADAPSPLRGPVTVSPRGQGAGGAA
ncbi:MAG: hypothetical protein JNJ54_08945 [Myxococcaceae bacterium]|nr:hypothetical protein [Myxococcaceae bacterium]